VNDRKGQRKRFAELKKAGWTITRTGGGHYKLTHPNGGSVIAPFSPSAAGSWRQTEQHIARIERGERTRGRGQAQ
jgi:predicted RNA binding protein YcfA (HicA-like mRNA interferase family)